MKYQNPILPGFHPDPSICRVEDDYYLVTSSFEYFPAIPVFHSKDLIHWEEIGHCITRPEQISLRKGIPSSTGVYAPTIRYHEGCFYVITTNVTYGQKPEGNFLIWTDNIHDPDSWSDPVYIDMPGIDPSLLFDDGHVYYTGAAEGKIIFCEIDITTGKRIGDARFLWEGTGGNDPEGPHLYKINGWYYLMISEGGTELGHMVTIARSRSLEEPFHACPENPILSNRSRGTEIKATGHADLFCDHEGNWWAVCLGIRCITYPFKHNLGRETMLMPVSWDKNEWPVMASNSILKVAYEMPSFASVSHSIPDNRLVGTKEFYDDFTDDELYPSWNFICEQPDADHLSFLNNEEKRGLLLKPNSAMIGAPENLTWMGRRQEHHECTVRTKLTASLQKSGDEAGLTVYLNHKHHYEIALSNIEGTRYILFRRQIGSLVATEHMEAVPFDTITLELKATKEMYSFSYSIDGEHFFPIGKGECSYLTTEVGGFFTGNYIGLYAGSPSKKTASYAVFEYFHYKA